MTMKRTILLALASMLWATGALAATITVPTDQPTIEAALSVALSGDTVYILDGTYDPVGTLNVNQAQTVSGQSEAGVIINIPAVGGYGFSVASSDVIMENFTLMTNVGNTNFPIHASGTGNPPDGYDNLTIQNVTIAGAHERTGFDVHGYNTVVLSQLTSSDATGGNGVQVTGCIGVVMDNITTSNNAWGSIAIYSSSSDYLNRGSDNVVIDGATLSLGEQNLYNQDEFGLFNTNIVVNGYGYMVRNINAPGYTFYQETEANAVAAALAGPGSHIIVIADGSLLVADGMSIQLAIDAANAGDTVNVQAGTYREQLSINKDLYLTGAGMAVVTVESPDAIDRTSYTITSWTGSTKTVDPVIGVNGPADVAITGLTVDGRDAGPGDFHGIFYYNASGSVTWCTVTNVSHPASPGAQNVANMVFTTDGTSNPVLDISNNALPNFQKAGILVMGPDISFSVEGNAITSIFSSDIAGNGIQLSYGATGNTANNVVDGVGFTGDDWSGSGILLFESGDIVMSGDEVNNSESGISYNNWGGWGWLAPAVVSIDITDILLVDNTWSFYAQLSGDGSDLDLVATDCTVTGSTGDAFDVYGTDANGSLYTGWENGNLNVSITGLTLNNTAIDGIWTANNPSVATNTVHSFVVSGSSFANTTGGAIANTFPETILAEQNYWDDLGGPIVGAKSGGAQKQAAMIQPSGFDTMERGGRRMVASSSADKAAETVTGFVDYSPWYGLPIGTSPMTWGTDDSIEHAIELASSDDTVNVKPGTYVELGQILVDKNIAIIGDPGDRPVVMTDSDTGSSGDARGWFLQTAGTHLVMHNLELDGIGHQVYQGLRSSGSGEWNNCALRNITFPGYAGTALAAFGDGNWAVTDCTFDNIGRIGFLAFGSGLTNSSFSGNTYTGKGVGDWLDYACEAGSGAVMTIENNTITACQGIASSDGSNSAGLLVTTFFGPGTTATINDNIITGNDTGVACGFDVDDLSVVVGRNNDLSANSSYGVSNSAPNTVDFLHNWWGDASGPYHPLLNPVGTGNEVSDFVLFEPWTGLSFVTVTPSTSGPLACGQDVTLTFNLTLDEYTPDVFGFNAVVRATNEVDWNFITSLNAFGATTNFMTADNGDGSYMISGTTQGNPTQPISGAGVYGLFTITFTTAADGVADITFDSFSLRDPENQPIAASATGATIVADCTGPPAITDLVSAPGHEKVVLNWTMVDASDVDHYEIWRAVWHTGDDVTSAYPEYDDDNPVEPIWPADYAAAVASAEWTQINAAVAGTAVTYEDIYAPRGVYYYEVFAVDAVANVGLGHGPLNRSTNYWLGDVPPFINGQVTVLDMDVLGNAFGTTSDDGVPPYNNMTDVGPTHDFSRLGIPTTDNSINFEDLMVFSMNFGIVEAAKSNKDNISSTVNLTWVEATEGQYALRLTDGVGIKGVHVRADLPEGSLGSVTAGGLLDSQSEMTFLKNIGNSLDVSVAVMGVNNGFSGSGDLFVVNSSTPIALASLTIEARGYDNSEIQVSLDESSGTVTPRVFALKANYPNPFNPMTKISFSLPEAQDVRLNVYGIDGTKVATLINETRAAGLHEVVWTGRNDAGQSVASGTYFYRIEAGPYSQVRKMTLMK